MCFFIMDIAMHLYFIKWGFTINTSSHHIFFRYIQYSCWNHDVWEIINVAKSYLTVVYLSINAYRFHMNISE